MESLKATRRDELGSRRARRLRKAGRIPGIIYGHDEDPMAVTLSRHDVDVAIHHGERLFEVDVDGAKQNVLLKEVQYDTFEHEILHVDLARVELDERVAVTVRIVLRGTPLGVSEDGVLTQSAAEANIECMVQSIPEEIVVPVTDLKVGDAMHMRDLPLPQGATLLDDEDALVCRVTVVAEEVEAEAVEEGAEALEPEVITEKKDQTQDEDQEASQ